jgi:hypothetical protein
VYGVGVVVGPVGEDVEVGVAVGVCEGVVVSAKTTSVRDEGASQMRSTAAATITAMPPSRSARRPFSA